MKNTGITFNPDELIKAVEDVRDHATGKRKITLRTTEVDLPAPAPEISPAKIVATRRALNLSQPVFARLLNVSTGTIESWENKRRKPAGAALRLLQVATEHPEVLMGSKR